MLWAGALEKRNPALISLVAFVALLQASPAEADPGAPITVEQAVDLALARAPELQASRHGVDAARARVDLARSAYWPRFSLEASYLARWPKVELPIELPPQVSGLMVLPEMDDIHHFRAGLQGDIAPWTLPGGPGWMRGRRP